MLSAQLAPSLPLELAERLLANAIRLLPLRPGRRGPLAFSSDLTAPAGARTNALHMLLSVLGPRALFREVTWTALDRCWWVDHDFASAIGDVKLLELLDGMSNGVGGAPQRPLQWTNKALDVASKKGFLHVLDWWYERFGAACWYTENALTGAAEAGHLDILKWWTDRKDHLSCDLNNNRILLHATLGGHKKICEWWLETHVGQAQQPDLGYFHQFPAVGVLVYALMHAIVNSDTDFNMFDWWLAHPYCSKSKLRGDHYANGHALALRRFIWDHRSEAALVIDRIPIKIGEADLLVVLHPPVEMCAAVTTDPSLTAWLDQHMPPMLLQSFVGTLYVLASAAGNVRVLEWLCGFGTPKYYLEKIAADSLTRASETGQVHVLDWWIDVCPWFGRVRSHFSESLTAGTNAVQAAAAAGHLDVLEWWKTKSRLLFSYGEPALRVAAQGGHVAILESLVRFGNRVVWSPEVVCTASQANRINVLDWWMQQQAQGKLSIGKTGTTNAIVGASLSGNIDALDWWYKTGWFLHALHCSSQIFPFESFPPAEVLDWWISLDKDQFGTKTFHHSLFTALAYSANTILFAKHIRRFGTHEPEAQLYQQAYQKAFLSGSICLLEWCLRREFPRPEQGVVQELKRCAGRHVKAWLSLNGVE
ncbi:hypothetical protein BCR44DRAFT_254238 [Catenaria anguillulae PL171]|uniref:Ankyrin repeat-containing domain protein n=1 Tax=Catenaria anguillulae PL171 TaxID=765915 RepID=A0A1Y2I1H9_9FUNG|nr:hypothetical protein BCR44DRAFT_254238 [Catenaria anguillulae PL171]